MELVPISNSGGVNAIRMAVDLKTFLAGAAAGAAAGASIAVALSLWRRRTLPPRGALRAHAPMDTAGVLAPGNVAVIIGSASGIGRHRLGLVHLDVAEE